jgi:hypothetical protein
MNMIKDIRTVDDAKIEKQFDYLTNHSALFI